MPILSCVNSALAELKEPYTTLVSTFTAANQNRVVESQAEYALGELCTVYKLQEFFSTKLI